MAFRTRLRPQSQANYYGPNRLEVAIPATAQLLGSSETALANSEIVLPNILKHGTKTISYGWH